MHEHGTVLLEIFPETLGQFVYGFDVVNSYRDRILIPAEKFVENRSVYKPDQDLVLSKRDDEYLKHLLKQFGSYGADQFNLMINF